MPLPNLKKVVKTKKGIAAIVVATTWLFWFLGMVGDLQTLIGIRPYLHYVSVLPTYGALVGAWIGDHFMSICGIAISVGLFTWAAYDVAEQERQEPSANIILASTTLRRVARGDPPYNWENATFASEDPQVALVARFANRARTVPVGIAHDVRADIIFEAEDGTRAACHPAPWLFRSTPIVSFVVGDTNELLVALDVLAFPQVPPPANMPQVQQVQTVLRAVEDIADRQPNSLGRYTYHVGLSGSVKARISLTANGLALPPFELTLRASDRNTIPQTPPMIRQATEKPNWWQRFKSFGKK